MRHLTSWLAMALLLVCFLAGCGNKTTVVNGDTSNGVGSYIKFVTPKEQKLQFIVDENKNLQDLRVGGIEVKPEDVQYVVYTSYRMGDCKTSPFKSLLDKDLSATFIGLPNNDQWGEYFVVLKSGKQYKVELSHFKEIKLPGLYEWIDPSESTIEYGDIEADSAQDRMFISLDESTMLATVEGQFGCDMLVGTALGVTNFTPGEKVVILDFNGNHYSGEIIQGADGNLSYKITGIPVVPAPYSYGDNYPGNIPTMIVDIYVELPDESRFSLNTTINSGFNEDDSEFIWYIDSDYYLPSGAEFGVSSDGYGKPMEIFYYPPSNN